MEIIVFNDNESDLIFKCQSAPKIKENETANDRIIKHINALVELARAISQYPSILMSTGLNGEEQSADTLIEMLCEQDDFDKIMHIPTKAVLGKGFLVAKINFFLMLQYLAEPIPELREEYMKISEDVSNIVFTLMSEEVFISLIEDKNIAAEIRNRAAFLLTNIWEYRLNHGVQEFSPILNSIWEARKKLCPVFGTLMGTSELLMMSADIDPKWLDFLDEKTGDSEVFQALEEFLFTLTTEELSELRRKMKKQGLNSVKKEQIEQIMGRKQMYPEFNESDSREMYRFFRDRKHNAQFRNRAGAPGPKKTIEEYIMCHLLSSVEWAVNL